MINNTHSQEKSGPLKGIKVIDLSLLLPGPLCSQHLGDMGADVIKIENPRAVDMTRLMGTQIKGKNNSAQNQSGMYVSLNRNKRAITLNIKREAGREVLYKLLQDADILLEGFRPDTLNKMGIGYEQLSKKFPRLIYCAISGYGSSGPYKNLAGHDATYMGYSGLLGINGEKNRRPVIPGFQMADINGGTLTALCSILAALYHREKSAEGQFLDISMLDGAFNSAPLQMGEYLASGELPRRSDMDLCGKYPNYDVYECSDGKYIVLATLEERFLRVFLKQIDREELIEQYDPKSKDLENLRKNLVEIFLQKTQKEWSRLFLHSDCCLAPVNNFQDALEDKQLKHRGMVFEVEHPELGKITAIGSAFNFSKTPCSYHRHVASHGQHTEEVLTEYGYTKEQLNELRKKRAI